ncbi:MAG: hybrid sensor histidine kinase/response regulator [Gemmatirosa sp.]
MDIAGCTILLIDDEEANLDLLALMLRPRGFRQLVRVSDAREAVAAFDAARPDLVLLDLHMPHRSGFEVLDELRAHVPAGEFLPVLVLTADATAQARERALAGGAHDFVLKPFDRVEVVLRVRNLLRTRLLHVEQRRAREAAERTAARDRLLADASRALGASFDTATALEQLVRVLVPALADGCAIALATDGELERVAEAGAVSDDEPSARPTSPSVLHVPLATAGPPAGWLLLERGAERAPFADEERALAAELARRAALAIENARLFRAAHDAVAARDQVLAVVAHDLRSPLTAARFDVEMLRAEPELPVGARDARMLLRVERAMARMDGLIEDLLDVARMNHDALALERRPQAMDALLTEAATSLRPLVESRGLRFVVHGPHALPTLDVEARRVLQAISNLVGNAAKFAAHEGTVALTWELAADALRIAVRDDGPGIPPEELQHIFGAFWQARHADRRGLGLGLSIALGIAEAHGGRIWVESRVGEGSTFVLALPTGGPRA